MRPLLVLSLLLAPRALVGQCPDGTPPPCGVRVVTAAPASVAVLYFDNVSGDSTRAYIADGLTEELISRLSQVERLQVKSRTAVLRLKGRRLDEPAALGRSLGVQHLVSGSVLPAGRRLRVTVELTRATTGVSEWSRTFDRSSEDLIGVQAEIAESVAVAVGGRLAPAERRLLESRPTRNGAAYDHFLRGNFERLRRTTPSLLSAVREYETAVRLDPRFATAWVKLGSAYSMLSGTYYSPEVPLTRDTLAARSRSALDRSLLLDSTSSDAWLARAAILERTDQEYSYALARAVALDPRNVDALHLYGIQLRDGGQDSAAVREFRAALAVDPGRTITLENLGEVFVLGRQYREAARWIDSSVAQAPDASFYYMEQALVRLDLGDTAGARSSAQQAFAHGGAVGREEVVAMLEARSGDSVAARARLVPLDSAMRGQSCFYSHACLELTYALAETGARDRALALFERLTPRDVWLVYWSRRSELDPIRDDPRFKAVLREASQH